MHSPVTASQKIVQICSFLWALKSPFFFHLKTGDVCGLFGFLGGWLGFVFFFFYLFIVCCLGFFWGGGGYPIVCCLKNEFHSIIELFRLEGTVGKSLVQLPSHFSSEGSQSGQV